MNQGHGILVFGFFFFIFLAWLWRYPDDPSQTPVGDNLASTQLQWSDSDTAARELTDLDRWLEENELTSLKSHFRSSGIKSLEDCLQLDVESHSFLTDDRTRLKLHSALPRLSLTLWLQKKGLQDYLPKLESRGYSSLLSLCEVDMDLVSELFPQSEKQKAFKAALETLNSGWCTQQSSGGWSIKGALFYGVVVLLVVAVILGVFIVIGVMVVQVVQYVVVSIFVFFLSALIHVFVVGIIGGLFSALTGRRGHMPPPPQPMPVFRPPPMPGFRETLGNVLGSFGRSFGQFFQQFFADGPPMVAQDSDPRPQNSSSFSLGLYERVRGTYLDVGQCGVEWNHENEAQVGNSSVMTIKLVSKNGSPYELKVSDVFHCRITSIADKAEIPHVVEPTTLEGHSTIKISFTARVSGQYRVIIKVNEKPIGSGEIFRKYLPGDVDPVKTVILDKTAVVVMTEGVYTPMKIIPKDSFGNKAIIDEQAIKIEIRRDSESGDEVYHELVVYKADLGHYELLIKMDKEGHYVGWVIYRGIKIGPPKFTIISLSDKNMQIVEKNVSKRNLNVYYEGVILEKGKKVYCYISPRQLQVREYFMKIIPTRTFTCKVSPATQIIFHAEPNHFTLDDGIQEPLTLFSPSREILGATFHKFVLKNIGGSEKFQDKRNFFYSKLREHHLKQSRSDKRITIDRIHLLESARRTTKNFSTSDWCKKFSITFRGEDGLDWGGVSREFFELICVNLFDASNKFFMRFNNDNHQALVHPNYASNRPSTHKLKHFAFAGRVVGKCLYESCMGNTLLVKARFSRSFLAQLIGLRINYKYFESDDPDLYTTKIQYILENNVADLGLMFAEEEFDSGQGTATVIPLVENGEEKEVTEENKLEYLNALAHYRLTKRVSEEIAQFTKGLNEIVPDSLLSMFDENELELLMCGMDTVHFEDLKENAIVSGSSQGFIQVLSWFWVVVSSFTQEEMAKLLQFVTGCSQLPPGGFKELNPRFTITSSPTRGRLPTAHTCFNQLCLPEYSSCEQFQTSLMTALNEGGEGFGMI